MRLTAEQIRSIKQVAHGVLGDDARVVLFGSRTDDNRRGGDIDLLFQTPRQLPSRVAALDALYVGLIRQLGDRKIDVLLKDAATPDAPVLRVALETGIAL
jgi:predicted nucleotidyltransferase